VKLVERARVLAAEAATGTATNRASSAIEAAQIHDQIVALTHTSSEGRYVFSGDKDSELLYAVDTTQSAGVDQLTTAGNTRLVEDVNGSRFSISKSAHELFDSRDGGGAPLEDNVFNAVHTLSQALAADDEAAVQQAIPKITASLEHLNRQLTFYGHAQNRVTDATTTAKRTIMARTEELSTVEDTDVTESLIRLQTSSLQLQVALGARAQMPTTTLFDFLA
jgi:flagellin-like hook-associated protein FlgL